MEKNKDLNETNLKKSNNYINKLFSKFNNESMMLNKWFVVFVFLYVIVAIVIVLILWLPKNGDLQKQLDYTSYNVDTTNEKFKDIYSNDLAGKLITKNYTGLFKVMDKEYLKLNNLTENNFDDFLRDNSYYYENIKLNDYQVVDLNKLRIYAFTYKIGSLYIKNADGVWGNSPILKNVNVIESKPYEYVVNFNDDFNKYFTYLNTDKFFLDNGVKYKISFSRNLLDKVEFKITVENVDNENLEIDFAEITTSKVVMSDGYTLYKSVNYSSYGNDSKKQEKGTTVEKNLIFDIPLSSQLDIKYIRLSKVNVNGKILDVDIPIY